MSYSTSSVSYTHLDVYKRQGLVDMRTRFDRQLEKLNVELIRMGALCEEAISIVAKSLLDSDPVSYTHLDVYKRQLPTSSGLSSGRSPLPGMGLCCTAQWRWVSGQGIPCWHWHGLPADKQKKLRLT